MSRTYKNNKKAEGAKMAAWLSKHIDGEISSKVTKLLGKYIVRRQKEAVYNALTSHITPFARLSEVGHSDRSDIALDILCNLGLAKIPEIKETKISPDAAR